MSFSSFQYLPIYVQWGDELRNLVDWDKNVGVNSFNYLVDVVKLVFKLTDDFKINYLENDEWVTMSTDIEWQGARTRSKLYLKLKVVSHQERRRTICPIFNYQQLRK